MAALKKIVNKRFEGEFAPGSATARFLLLNRSPGSGRTGGVANAERTSGSRPGLRVDFPHYSAGFRLQRRYYPDGNGLKGGLSLLPRACPSVSAKPSILSQMPVYQSLKSNGKKGE